MNMRLVTEVRPTGLRAMCIKYDYYTRGTNEEYSNMLLKYREVDAEAIEWLANDIKAHSNTAHTVEEIAHNIVFDCCNAVLYTEE